MIYVDISSVLLSVINSVKGLFLLTVACEASVDMSLSENRKPTSFSLSLFLFFLRLKQVSRGKMSVKNFTL